MPVSPTREDADLGLPISLSYRQNEVDCPDSTPLKTVCGLPQGQGAANGRGRCILGPFRTTISSAQSKSVRLMESVGLPSAESEVIGESLQTAP